MVFDGYMDQDIWLVDGRGFENDKFAFVLEPCWSKGLWTMNVR